MPVDSFCTFIRELPVGLTVELESCMEGGLFKNGPGG
jgi:hypothetical protein